MFTHENSFRLLLKNTCNGQKGLLPIERQYVHLSIGRSTAEMVGSRRKGDLVILTIRAKEAFLNNIRFYKEENGIWLSDPISSKYIVE